MIRLGGSKQETYGPGDTYVAPLVMIDRDSFHIRIFGRTYGAHLVHPRSECRQYYEPYRLYLNLGHLGSFLIGLPNNKTLKLQEDKAVPTKVPWYWDRTQQWSWSRGYGEPRRWRIVSYNPPRWAQCREPIGKGGICGAAKWHRGPHRSPNDRSL